MCENKESTVLAETFDEFYTFALHSIRRVLNNTDADKVTWYAKNRAYTSGENDPESFVSVLYDAGLILFKKNHSVIGNFVLTGKQGFDILKKIGRPRFIFEKDQGVLDSTMKVKYNPSIDDNMFIVSVYERLNFNDDSDYKSFKNIEAVVVGEIIDAEMPYENIDVKSEINDKRDAVSVNIIKHDHKTHLIFGKTGCGKTTLFRQLIQEKLNRDEDVFVFGSERYLRLYFNDKSNSKLHTKDINNLTSNVGPKELAKEVINFCYSIADRNKTTTIAIDGFEQFKLNKDYSQHEYFRELVKECRNNDINILYTLSSDSDKKESYHKLPEIYERFSDIITVLK